MRAIEQTSCETREASVTLYISEKKAFRQKAVQNLKIFWGLPSRGTCVSRRGYKAEDSMQEFTKLNFAFEHPFAGPLSPLWSVFSLIC